MKFANCALLLFFFTSSALAQDFQGMGWLKSKMGTITTTKLSDTEIGSGLKDALKVGIENTIKFLGKQDGYMGNQAVKILLPKNLQNMQPALQKMGLGPKMDEFTLSMNRAAEKAAPLAADIFASAIASLSIDDAQKILNGGNTAATDYLRKATYNRLLDKFKPAVVNAMNDYDVSKKYQDVTGKMSSLPFMGQVAGKLDLSNYVSSKALDGLFCVLGQQEAEIRSNPSARVTDLLKKVFSNH
jgi:hypothetical protein